MFYCLQHEICPHQEHSEQYTMHAIFAIAFWGKCLQILWEGGGDYIYLNGFLSHVLHAKPLQANFHKIIIK